MEKKIRSKSTTTRYNQQRFSVVCDDASSYYEDEDEDEDEDYCVCDCDCVLICVFVFVIVFVCDNFS